jgi:hypothetical protein
MMNGDGVVELRHTAASAIGAAIDDGNRWLNVLPLL